MQIMLSILNDIMKTSWLIIKVVKNSKIFDRQKVLVIAIKSCKYVFYISLELSVLFAWGHSYVKLCPHEVIW